MIDLISRVPRLPVLGETMFGHSFHLGYGGKGANQAVMAAKLGAHVATVAKLGRDVFGEGTLKNYRERGVLLVEEERVEDIPAVQVPAVDPTGAGDAFISSLAVFLAEGLSTHDAIQRANAVAALSVTQIGTQVSFPQRAEADGFHKQPGLM